MSKNVNAVVGLKMHIHYFFKESHPQQQQKKIIADSCSLGYIIPLKIDCPLKHIRSTFTTSCTVFCLGKLRHTAQSHVQVCYEMLSYFTYS